MKTLLSKSIPAFVLCMMLSGCGYHVVGTAGNTIPKSVETIAVPTFKNDTTAFKLEQILTAAVSRELTTRTRYKVLATDNVGDADAVLRGTITGFVSYPTVFDPQTNRATTAQINVRAKVSLVERKTGKILYENGDLVFRGIYEISGQASTYFDESTPSAERLSRTFAASLVSSILSGF